ncbi:hypothetical protein [Xenorhabdus thailandensis]|uniref:hypothetical protein n=1 Tax=Xenorhabdus thailandensis TaxID=3136255 RepID=UPI0030F4A0C2
MAQTGLGRGANRRYGRYDESGRWAGQAVCRHVRADGDAEAVVEGEIARPVFLPSSEVRYPVRIL